MFNNQVLAVDQAVVLDFQDTRLILVPKLVQLVSSEALMNGNRSPDGEELRTFLYMGIVYLQGKRHSRGYIGSISTNTYPNG